MKWFSILYLHNFHLLFVHWPFIPCLHKTWPACCPACWPVGGTYSSSNFLQALGHFKRLYWQWWPDSSMSLWSDLISPWTNLIAPNHQTPSCDHARDSPSPPSCIVYSSNELKWSTLPWQQGALAIVQYSQWPHHLDRKVLCNKNRHQHALHLHGMKKIEQRWKQVLSPMPMGRFCLAAVSHNNFLLLVMEWLKMDPLHVLNTTVVLDLTTMKWTTPEGLDLPVPLWEHNLAFCGEYTPLPGWWGYSILY